MTTERPLRYCLNCGAENARSADLCRRCGRRLVATRAERRSGAAFMLNELEGLRDEREIDGELYLRLRPRYLPLLGQAAAAAAPTGTQPAPRAVPPAAAAPPTRGAPPQSRRATAPTNREGPGWLVEQQANLLLYLGAFLIVMATLVYVGFSGQSSYSLDDRIKMGLLSAFTLSFLLAGLYCLRVPRVRQAGVVFFALGSLLVPLNFVGAYGFFLADDNIDPLGLWLAGSISSALFYAAISYTGLGKWYAVPMIGASFSSAIAVLTLSGAPPEAYPGSFIALAVVLSVPQLLPPGKTNEAFGPLGTVVAHAVVPVALAVALGMTVAGGSRSDEAIWRLTTRWYLPPTAFAGAIFYWAQAFGAQRMLKQLEGSLCVVALAVSGGAAVTIVYAMDVGYQWYGTAIAMVGVAYGISIGATTGSRWAGRQHLPWMALGAVTVAWVCFEGVYTSFPRTGAGVHLGAAAFYLVAARLSTTRVHLFDLQPAVGRTEKFEVESAVALFYAAALTIGLGVFEIVSAAHHVGTAQAENATWTFFGVSLLMAAAGASMRWWWPGLTRHVYAVAFGMGLFVLSAAAQAEGDVTLFLGAYSLATLTLAVWERQPLGLTVPACFGFVTLLAGWRYYEPSDAALPLVLSGAGGVLFALAALLPVAARRFAWRIDTSWAAVMQAIAFAYAVVAPLAGGARLAMLVDDAGLIDGTRFDSTLLFRTTAVSVGLVALAGATTRWWWQAYRGVIYAIALGMAVGVSAAAAQDEGQVTILLAAYGALALALAIWEREPVGLIVPACFGFVALLAGWRYYEPNDAALPLVLSGTAGALFAVSALLPIAARRLGRSVHAHWAATLQAIAFAYVVVAPIAGGARLAMLANDSGLIGGEHFESTLLFQTTAVAVGLVALAGMTTRWWWHGYRPVVYAIALSMAVGLSATSAQGEGQVTVLLAGYGALALALTIWEREPLGLAVPAGFGYFALVAAWRYYEPNDALLPLSISAVGAALFAAALLLGPAARRLRLDVPNRAWANVLEALAIAYAAVAPVSGWIRLSLLTDDSGLVGAHHFEVTALYQTAAASVALLGLLIAVRSWSRRRLELGVLASALLLIAALLEIGHFSPENAQAYTAPLGAYLLVLGLLALRVRTLSEDVRTIIPAVEVLGASLIMGPSFVQSLDADAWRYGLVLLAESIGFVSLAIVQRRIWLMAGATTFVVMDGAHYLFFAGGPVLPNWAILAIAGISVMAAGTAILVGRDRWTAWQHSVQAWWYHDEIRRCDNVAS